MRGPGLEVVLAWRGWALRLRAQAYHGNVRSVTSRGVVPGQTRLQSPQAGSELRLHGPRLGIRELLKLIALPVLLAGSSERQLTANVEIQKVSGQAATTLHRSGRRVFLLATAALMVVRTLDASDELSPDIGKCRQKNSNVEC